MLRQSECLTVDGLFEDRVFKDSILKNDLTLYLMWTTSSMNSTETKQVFVQAAVGYVGRQSWFVPHPLIQSFLTCLNTVGLQVTAPEIVPCLNETPIQPSSALRILIYPYSSLRADETCPQRIEAALLKMPLATKGLTVILLVQLDSNNEDIHQLTSLGDVVALISKDKASIETAAQSVREKLMARSDRKVTVADFHGRTFTERN